MSDIKIRVNLDGQEANLTLSEISNKIEDLNQQAAGLDQASEEFNNLTDQINALKKALDESIKINVDSTEADQKIDDLKGKTNELSQPIDIQVVANTDVAETQINQLDQTINNVDSNIEFTSTLDTSEVESEINDLQSQEPINLEINTNADEVKSDIDSIESKDINVEVTSNAGEVSSELDEIASKSIDIPVTGDVTPLEEELNSLNSDIDLTINSNISEVESDINDLDSEINVEIKGNTDQIKSEIEDISGQIEVPITGNTNEIEQQIQEISEEITVPVTGDISDVEQKLDSIDDKEVNVSVKTEVDSTEVDNLNSTLDSIEDKEVNVTTNVDSSDLSQVSDEINELEDKEVNISTNINTDNLDEFVSEVDKLEDKTIEINTEVNDEKLDEISSKIDEIKDKEVQVTVQSESQELDTLSNDLNSLEDKDVTVNVNVDSTPIENISTEIDSIEDKEVNVTVNTGVYTTPVDELNNTLDSIENKEVNVSVVTDDTQLDNLNSEIDSLEGKEVQVKTNVDDSQVQELSNELNSLEDKQVDVSLNVSNEEATEVLSDTQDKIQTIKDDSIIQLSVSSNKEEIDALINKMKEGKVSAQDLDSVIIKPKVDDSSIKNLKSSIDEVNDEEITPTVDDKEIKNFNKDLDDTKNKIKDLGDTPSIKPVSEDTTKTYGQLKKELLEIQQALESTDPDTARYRDLQNQLKDVSIEVINSRERIEDFNDVLKVSTGSPIEQFKNSILLTKESLLNLDFAKFKTGVAGIGNSLSQSVIGPLKESGKSLSGFFTNLSTAEGASGKFKVALGGVTTGFQTLGKAIIATGIGALVAIIGTLIANFDELKNASGGIGKIFQGIGSVISSVTDTVKAFTDAIKLTSFAVDEATEKTKQATLDNLTQVDAALKEEIEKRKIYGKETLDLEIESLRNQQRINRLEIDSLRDKVQQGGKLTDEEIAKKKELIAVNDALGGSIELLRLKNAKELDDRLRTAGLEGAALDKELRDKNLEEINQYYDDQIKIAKEANKSEEEIDKLRAGRNAEINKTNSDFNKKQDDERKKNADKAKAALDKATQEETKYRQDLLNLTAKYSLSEQQQIEAKYEKEVKIVQDYVIKRNKLTEFDPSKATEEELKILEDINANKLQEIAAYNNKVLDSQNELNTKILALSAQSNQEILDAEIADIERRQEIELRGVKEGSQKEKEIKLRYQNESLAATQEFANKESQVINDASEKQVDKILEERERITNSNIGIFGKIDALNENLAKEKAALEKQRDDLLAIQNKILSDEKSTEEQRKAAKKKIEELNGEFQTKLIEQEEEGSKKRKELIAEEIELRAKQAQDLVNAANSILDANLNSEQTDLDIKRDDFEAQAQLEQQALEDSFERRRLDIERSLASESEKNAALEALGKERESALKGLDQSLTQTREQLDKKQIEITKKGIRRERDAALAQVAIAAATGIAGAIKSAASGSLDPISFALSMAATLATAYAAIKKAKDAMKEADAAAARVGSGGGGSIGGSDSPPPLASPPQSQSPVVPVATAPDAVNPIFQQNNSQNQQTPPTQQFVSVVEIERVRNSVTAVEVANTIG